MSGIYVPYPANTTTGSVSATTIAFGVGALDGLAANASGASVSSTSIFMQSATATFPGLVNSTSQTFSGVKTFSSGVTSLLVTGSISATGVISGANVSGSNTSDLSLAVVGNTPNANGGSIAASQILTLQPADATHGGVVSTASQTFAGSKSFTASILSADGTIAAPSIGFINEPGTGFYRTGTGVTNYSILGNNSFSMQQVVGSNTNFGFGGAASGSVGNALSCNYTYNGATIFSYANLSQGTSAETKLSAASGAGGSVNFSLRNLAYGSQAYIGGGCVLDADSSCSFLNIAAENTGAYIAMNVGGLSLATERIRINPTNFTLNGGMSFIVTGTSSTGIAITQFAPASGTGYSITWPTAQGAANTFPSNNGSGTLTWAAINHSTNVIGSVSLSNQVSGSLPFSSVTGSVSLTNQVVNNLPLSQTSGSISLTTQVSGLLPLANFQNGGGGTFLTTATSSAVASWVTLKPPTKQLFTTLGSASYFTPAGCVFIKVTVVGGGGGSGGCAIAGATASAAGGGGGGGTSISYSAPSPLQVIALVVGAGGPGGAPGANAGITGSQSIFAGTYTGGGGVGGGAGGTQAIGFDGIGGTGGAGSNGTFNIPGSSGFTGIVLSTTQVRGGEGGMSQFGPMGIQFINGNGSGGAGQGFGGGATGSANQTGNGAQAGSAGAAGMILVEEYYQ